ncbi:MAG TPA: NmrA family NAD(P)-binding protein [Minicystis sp.]|nr:NmrA family NAD(P)-binding protein [Minicystis sp.]
MFVVAGVTGNTGSVVANVLLSQGEKVRVLVRDAAKGASWKAKGAEIAVADIYEGDEAALTKALTGAKGAYLLLPPAMREDVVAVRDAAVPKLARAVKASGVPHVVFLSSIGAQHAAGVGPIGSLHAVEQALRAAGVSATFLRAAYFLDNLASGAQPAANDGVFPAFGHPGYPYAMVASDDIGRAAAKLLLAPSKGVRVVNLEGPAAYSLDDAAAAFGRALGRPVKAPQVPTERIADTLAGFGMPRANAAEMQEMIEGASKGLLAWEPGVETMKGDVSLDAFVTRLVAKLGKS